MATPAKRPIGVVYSDEEDEPGPSMGEGSSSNTEWASYVCQDRPMARALNDWWAT